jgi:SAM-dependent methyltransferase
VIPVPTTTDNQPCIPQREKLVKWTNYLRQQELDAVRQWLLPRAQKHQKLLEVGGGNGLLAGKLADMGFDVVSIDPAPQTPLHFPVEKGDCMNLLFQDESFDVIFSSCVLEHIGELDTAFSEMSRVLRKDGIMVHTVPTHYSMIYTMFTQPVGYLIKIGLMLKYGFKFLAQALAGLTSPTRTQKQTTDTTTPSVFNKANLKLAIAYANPIRFLVPWPHGAAESCFAEIRNWNPDVWRKKFQQAGLKIIDVISLPAAYSMHLVFPFRFMKLRYWLGRKGAGIGCSFLLTKSQSDESNGWRNLK